MLQKETDQAATSLAISEYFKVADSSASWSVHSNTPMKLEKWFMK
jgi:hypothetical protein